MAVDSEHAVEILSEIFDNGVQSDLIILIAGVGRRRFPIHRVVLTANSKYFTAALGPNFAEADKNEFIFDKTDGPTLKAIVDFCYTGRIDLTEENARIYLTIASSVELRLLERKCFRFLTDELNITNALMTLELADKYNDHVLRRNAFRLVCKSFDELPQWHIDGMNKRLLEEVLRNDSVDADEQLIFERLLGWFKQDRVKRRQHMTGLLKLIRLPLISSQYVKGDTMQQTYKEFGCFAEYEKRIANLTGTVDEGIRRLGPFYCLSKQYEGDAGAQQSAAKIERYISALNEFEEIGGIELGQRKYFGATLHEDKVYILGGHLNNVSLKSVSVFDLASSEERALPEMATARDRFASILVGRFIYVFGGRDGLTKEQLTSCERFDLETEIWQQLTPMNVPRSNAAVSVLNGNIYVAGGYNKYNWSRILKDVEMFDPQNDEWITITPMNDAKSCFDLSTSKKYLYAFGDRLPIERYDSLTTRWAKIRSPCNGIASSMVVNDSIYVIKKNGEFGRVKHGGSGFLFSHMALSKFKTGYAERHLSFCY